MNSFNISKQNNVIGPDLICPFCNAHITYINGETTIEISVTPERCQQVFYDIFTVGTDSYLTGSSSDEITNQLVVKYVYCPYCNKTSYMVYDCDHSKCIKIYPPSFARIFPNTVPSEIYKDYREACEILHLSPNASATLSRRCLQSMIRNRWGIELSKLESEINNIKKEDISKLERKVLHTVRGIGNIGSHPNEIVDVSVEDAELSIKVIEIFLQKWYIDDPADEQLFNYAIANNNQKQKAIKAAQSDEK